MSSDFEEQETPIDDEEDWTYSGGLLRGWVATSIAGVGLAAAFGLATHYLPFMTRHWGLNALWALLMTHILYMVMHRYSGMVGQGCDVGVMTWMGAILVTHYVVVMAEGAARAGTPLTLTLLWEPLAFFLISAPMLVAAGFGYVLCRNGDNSLDYLAEILTTNPMTGWRR